MHWRRKWQPTPAFLPGESQGPGSLVGCHLWGCTESDMTKMTQQQQQRIPILNRFLLYIDSCSLNEVMNVLCFQVRRWAILTARNLGKVDRDDYYDLQEVLTCLFKVIELGLLENPDIYTSSVLEKGKLVLLPSHMYDTANYKNYWLGEYCCYTNNNQYFAVVFFF